MRSKANIKSHPIHPMLIAFPVAFFSGTLLFDILFLLLNKDRFSQTASYLCIAGVISALIAAIPGIIDYIHTVPPESSAKKRAAKHGILNVTHVIIFFIAWLIRDDISFILILMMEVIGLTLLIIAGWMGGTLVYRNQIGVDVRYADAGKWKELTIEHAKPFIEVASMDELAINQMKLLHIEGKRIVLARTEEGYVAFDDRCTHKGGSLAGGSMMCGTVQCPWHGSQFDVRTGKVKAGPAEESINVYGIKEQNGKIFLSFD